MHIVRITLTGLIAAVFCVMGSIAASAQDFYAGKTMKIYVGFAPGGGYDIYARALARYMGNSIPGKPTIVTENMPGAGGLRLANFMAQAAPKDGLDLAVISEGGVLEQVYGNPAVQFDAAKFGWIGRMVSSTSLYFTWHTSPTKSFEDLRQRKTTFGSTGAGNTDMFPKAMNKLAGAQFNIIAGYQGSNEIYLAVERGEVEAAVGHYVTLRNTKQDWLRDGKINPIVVVSPKRVADLPNVPTMAEMGKTAEDRSVLALLSEAQLGRSYHTTPNVPAERIAILRKAFMDTMQDPEFLKYAEQQKLVLEIMNGEETQQTVEHLLSTPKAIAQKAFQAVN
jgi:tripartite-type tricarboxylate transporter receptor subunit TctC